MNSQENKTAKSNKKLTAMTEAAAIAALYAVLTVALHPLSYGPLQCRVSEALTILPVRKRSAIIGLTLGCAIANAVGIMIGADSLGVADILFGTIATLLAAIATRLLRKVTIKGVPFLGALMPVISNGLIIGAELTFILHLPFWSTALWVAIGEMVSVFVLGLPLNALIGKLGILKED